MPLQLKVAPNSQRALPGVGITTDLSEHARRCCHAIIYETGKINETKIRSMEPGLVVTDLKRSEEAEGKKKKRSKRSHKE